MSYVYSNLDKIGTPSALSIDLYNCTIHYKSYTKYNLTQLLIVNLNCNFKMFKY
jgi:hypothetical protein